MCAGREQWCELGAGAHGALAVEARLLIDWYDGTTADYAASTDEERDVPVPRRLRRLRHGRKALARSAACARRPCVADRQEGADRGHVGV